MSCKWIEISPLLRSYQGFGLNSLIPGNFAKSSYKKDFQLPKMFPQFSVPCSLKTPKAFAALQFPKIFVALHRSLKINDPDSPKPHSRTPQATLSISSSLSCSLEQPSHLCYNKNIVPGVHPSNARALCICTTPVKAVFEVVSCLNAVH